MNIKLLVVIISVIMISCETISPPKEPNENTLVVGKLVVDIARGRNDELSRLIGTHTGGVYSADVSFNLKNNETGKTTYITTKKDGWIISRDLSGGNYTIKQFVFFARSHGVNHTVKVKGPFNITIEEKNVNNLGIIQINVLPLPPYPQGRYSINDDKDFNTVKNDFKNSFPNSGWNNYDWNDVSLEKQ